MKKTILYGLLALSLCACGDDTEDAPKRPDLPEIPTFTEGRRTVLVYMAAQNSLGRGYHEQDSIEIMAGRNYIADHDRLLLYIDDQDAPRIYRVSRHQDQPQLLKRWDKDVCSTDPKNFEEVLRFVKQHVPAEEYGLVMWSHADGWIPARDTDYDKYAEKEEIATDKSTYSFGIDSGPNGRLSNTGANMEVTDLAASITNAGLHCKFIFFDACLMQNLEVAYALRHATDYLIAAPMSTPAAGSYYKHDIQHGFFAEDPSILAQTYLNDVQSPELANSYSDYGLCISSIRTDRMEYLAQTLKEALPYSKLMGRQSPDMVVEDLDKPGEERYVLNYQAFAPNYFYRPHNYDALQSLRCILPEAHYEKVKAALLDAITFHGSTEKFWIGPTNWDYQYVPVKSGDYCGVSMFIPQTLYTEIATHPKYSDVNKDFQATEWYKAAGFDVTGW